MQTTNRGSDGALVALAAAAHRTDDAVQRAGAPAAHAEGGQR
jgi:hypothetical protein